MTPGPSGDAPHARYSVVEHEGVHVIVLSRLKVLDTFAIETRILQRDVIVQQLAPKFN